VVPWRDVTRPFPARDGHGQFKKKGNEMSDASAANEPATEITVKPEQAVAPRPVDKFAEYAVNRAALEANLVREELGSAQMDAILNATTEEELDAAMAMAGLVGLRDLEDGTEIQINGFHYAPGTRTDFANRFGIFAVMECTLLETSANVAIDTGVERIITWLRAMEAMGKFPVQRRVVKITTGSGNDMITLLPLKKRAVQ
jgi:hypothetical protein